MTRMFRGPCVFRRNLTLLSQSNIWIRALYSLSLWSFRTNFWEGECWGLSPWKTSLIGSSRTENQNQTNTTENGRARPLCGHQNLATPSCLPVLQTHRPERIKPQQRRKPMEQGCAWFQQSVHWPFCGVISVYSAYSFYIIFSIQFLWSWKNSEGLFGKRIDQLEGSQNKEVKAVEAAWVDSPSHGCPAGQRFKNKSKS